MKPKRAELLKALAEIERTCTQADVMIQPDPTDCEYAPKLREATGALQRVSELLRREG